MKQGLNEDKLLENVPASANVNEIIVIDDDDDDNLSQEPATKRVKLNQIVGTKQSHQLTSPLVVIKFLRDKSYTILFSL